jgi:hypothetical protein
MASFPVIDPPINSTTALVLQKSKAPENDYDKWMCELNQVQLIRKQILSGKNTPLRKMQLQTLGAKEQKIVRKIHNIKVLLKKVRRYDLAQCFVQICKTKMSGYEFEKIMNQAKELSDLLKKTALEQKDNK